LVAGIAYRVKKYVEVVARHDADGGVVPLSIAWEDGRTFEVDQVLDRRQAASLKVGGNGLRFRVRIGSSETFLFYENPRWFVEKIITEEEAIRENGGRPVFP